MRSGTLGTRIWAAALPLLASAMSCHADFKNGGFETGSLQDWTHEYSIYDHWKGTCATGSPCFRQFTSGCEEWYASPPWVQPQAQVITQYTLPDGAIVNPAEGIQMAQIGDLGGNQHATRLQQTIKLTGYELVGPTLHLDYGALMVDGQHACNEQAFLMVKVEIKKLPKKQFPWTKVLPLFEEIANVQVNASDAKQTGSGWAKHGKVGGFDAYYKAGTIDVQVPRGLPSNTELRVSIIIAGCQQGGHGAIAFLDNVRLDHVCELDCLTGANDPIPPPAWIPNAFTPNGDGLNDIWEIKGVTYALNASCLIFDRWGNLFHVSNYTAPPGQTFQYATLSVWDGRTMAGHKAPIDTYVYKLYLWNCFGQKDPIIGSVTLIR